MSRWLASWSCLGVAACMLSALRCWINCMPPCARYVKWLLTIVAGLLSIHPPPSTRYRGGSGSFTSTKQPVQKRWPGWRTAWPSTSGTNSVPRGTSLSAPGSLMDSSHRSFVPKCIHIVVQLFEKLPRPVRSRQTCFKLMLHAIPLPACLGGATVAGHSMCHIFFSGKWLLLLHSMYYCQVSQAVSLQPLTAGAHIHSQGINMGTCGRLSFRPALLPAVLCWLCQISFHQNSKLLCQRGTGTVGQLEVEGPRDPHSWWLWWY